LIIPGISRDNPYETVAFGQKIMNASGLTTFLIKSPSTVKPTQAGIIRYYETIADRLGRHAPGAKIIIYSVPSRTGGDGIKPDTAIALAQHPNIAALKDASRTRYPKSEEGDAKYTDDMARIIEETKKFGFTLLSGDDDRTHNLMEVGAKGSISVAANVDPRRVSRMVDLCLDGNYDAAALINGELNPLYRALFVESNPIPLHYALERLGIPAGNPRLPMTPATQETRALMNEVLSGLNLI
jgi:4-hydroxy-tetrahydrodipicolinate synthase